MNKQGISDRTYVIIEQSDTDIDTETVDIINEQSLVNNENEQVKYIKLKLKFLFYLWEYSCFSVWRTNSSMHNFENTL